MQKAPNTDEVAKKKGLHVMSWFTWNRCPCCGPRNAKDKQLEHQSVRAMLKQEDIDYIIFGEDDENGN